MFLLFCCEYQSIVGLLVLRTARAFLRPSRVSVSLFFTCKVFACDFVIVVWEYVLRGWRRRAYPQIRMIEPLVTDTRPRVGSYAHVNQSIVDRIHKDLMMVYA